MTKPETYMKVADRYMKKFTETIKAHPDCNFRDISANILSALDGYARLINKEKSVHTEDRSSFLRNLKKVREYYRLLDDFPEFLQGELSEDGAFPDLLEFVNSIKGYEQGQKVGIEGAQGHYVYLAKKRLEGKLATS